MEYLNKKSYDIEVRFMLIITAYGSIADKTKTARRFILR